MIYTNTLFGIRCDRCRAIYENSEGEYALGNQNDILEDAKNNGWAETESGRHLCPDCWEEDVTEDSIIIRPWIPQSIWNLIEFIRYAAAPGNTPKMTETETSWEISLWLNDADSVPEGLEKMCRHVLENCNDVNPWYRDMDVKCEVERKTVHQTFYNWKLTVTVEKPNYFPAGNENVPQAILTARSMIRDEVRNLTGKHLPPPRMYRCINGNNYRITSENDLLKGIEIDQEAFEKAVEKKLYAKTVFLSDPQTGRLSLEVKLLPDNISI